MYSNEAQSKGARSAGGWELSQKVWQRPRRRGRRAAAHTWGESGGRRFNAIALSSRAQSHPDTGLTLGSDTAEIEQRPRRKGKSRCGRACGEPGGRCFNALVLQSTIAPRHRNFFTMRDTQSLSKCDTSCP